MLPDELKSTIESLLSDQKGMHVSISETRPVGGGCINQACRLKTGAGDYFLKYNSASAFPGMFEKEAAGLKILSGTQTISIPQKPEIIHFCSCSSSKAARSKVISGMNSEQNWPVYTTIPIRFLVSITITTLGHWFRIIIRIPILPAFLSCSVLNHN